MVTCPNALPTIFNLHNLSVTTLTWIVIVCSAGTTTIAGTNHSLASCVCMYTWTDSSPKMFNVKKQHIFSVFRTKIQCGSTGLSSVCHWRKESIFLYLFVVVSEGPVRDPQWRIGTKTFKCVAEGVVCHSPHKVPGTLEILRRGKMVCTDLTWLFVRMSVCVQ